MTIKELEKAYKKRQLIWKTSIRMKSSKTKRFFGWLWFFIAFPFVWLFYNIRDFRTVLFVTLSFILWSASVWVWYLLAIFSGWETNLAKWFIGVGTTIWVWWASPVGSPFILLVTFTAIGMKALFNKITTREKKSHRKVIGTTTVEDALNKCDLNHEKEKINGKQL